MANIILDTSNSSEHILKLVLNFATEIGVTFNKINDPLDVDNSNNDLCSRVEFIGSYEDLLEIIDQFTLDEVDRVSFITQIKNIHD